jgi:hypothetical protein
MNGSRAGTQLPIMCTSVRLSMVVHLTQTRCSLVAWQEKTATFDTFLTRDRLELPAVTRATVLVPSPVPWERVSTVIRREA